LRSVLDSNQPLSLGQVLTPQILIALIGLALLSLLPVAYKAWRRHQEGDAK
jgi:hypothetical protein